jgi:hypothetical protein
MHPYILTIGAELRSMAAALALVYIPIDTPLTAEVVRGR